MKPGIYHGLSNEAYHSGPGVSKSQLDDIARDPAIYVWRRNAPVDTDKTAALDMGSALHCLLLEPDLFDKRYITAPAFNRRTSAGKEEEKQFLKECALMNLTVLEAEQNRKLQLMRASALAHHAVRFFLEADGQCESSVYWEDSETSELCRIRPDKYLLQTPVILDVKKVSDMSRFSRHIEEFRYHVQDAFYREGYLKHFGEFPQFVFIAVSESIDCGRYPVHAFHLDEHDLAVGRALFRQDLKTYHQCRLNNCWGGIEEITRPDWARKKDNHHG